MRNLIILMVAIMSVSCSKYKLDNCLIGTWKKSNYKITISDNKITFENGASISYTVEKNILHYSSGNCDIATCNGNTMTLTATSCNGYPSAISAMNGTYTKL